ncbi:hypothetical protein [Fluviicola taffensis]|uniref:hypothetical protein n=1 Tax=Fluviicola taffensis TaxID=191579 RepID=UPI003137C9EC
MNITIQYLKDNDKILGVVVSGILSKMPTLQEKAQLEAKITNHIFDSIFPGKLLHLYRDYYSDGVSICALLDINSIPQTKGNI